MFGKKNKISILVTTLTVALLVYASSVAQEKQDPEIPIKNLQFQAAEINSVMTSLGEYGKVNVVVSPDVTGTVTIKLNNVLWRDAMGIIGRTYDLAVVDEAEGYIRVLNNDKYRKEVTEERKHSQDQRSLVALDTRIVKISNSSADNILTTVQSLLTERGKATADTRSNSIIIQEVPSNIDVVLSYVAELDKPSVQIKISAQLIEISSQELRELGVKWTAEGKYISNSGRTLSQKGEVLADRGADVLGRYTVGAVQHGWDLTAMVEAMVSDGNGKIVAHPEITTLDNMEARIQMGQKVPIKQFDESGNVVIKLEEVGTILVVTPHITAENQILMHLKPERSTYEFNPNGVIINTNNAETHVIVENGQTAVIGGLTTMDEVETEVGVPFFKDIPIIGSLFKYTTKRVESRDLVIFVTPTIVGSELAVTP